VLAQAVRLASAGGAPSRLKRAPPCGASPLT
jgi:hypothetical protein